jgi:hypothetical protein
MNKLALLLIALSSSVVFAQTADPDDRILFMPSASHPVTGSRFSVLVDFQKGLLTAAKTCNIRVAKPEVFADGALGLSTGSLIKQVAMCDIYNSELGATPARFGMVTVRLWKRIVPNVPVPNALERSFIMSLGAEATDYPDIEFNSPTDGGIITWGPQGATVGQAHQVQQILSAVDSELPGLLDSAFGAEAPAVRLLARTTKDAAAAHQVSAIRASKYRRAIWQAGFKQLGEDVRVRAVYDRLMTAMGTAGIPEAISDFYRSYWKHGWCPTEADLGFFVDRAVQIAVFQKLTDQAADDVIEVEKAHGTTFTPAQRRRALAANFWSGKVIYAGNRLARDVAYYIDSIPRAELNNKSLNALVAKRGAVERKLPELMSDEVKRWSNLLGFSASAYGLSDRPAAVPFGLINEPLACTSARTGQ